MKEEKINLLVPYVKTGGKLIPYQGGPNFEKGNTPCPDCGKPMTKKPIGQAYIEHRSDYLLVNISGTDGVMTVCKDLEVEICWLCDTCSIGHRVVKEDEQPNVEA